MKRIFQINSRRIALMMDLFSSELMLFIFKQERELKRAVPSLEDQEVGMTEGVATTKMKSDVPNPGVRKAVPKPSYGKTSHSQSKKTEAYNLA